MLANCFPAIGIDRFSRNHVHSFIEWNSHKEYSCFVLLHGLAVNAYGGRVFTFAQDVELWLVRQRLRKPEELYRGRVVPDAVASAWYCRKRFCGPGPGCNFSRIRSRGCRVLHLSLPCPPGGTASQEQRRCQGHDKQVLRHL